MKKPMPLFVPVLWFGTAAIWCAIVALRLLCDNPTLQMQHLSVSGKTNSQTSKAFASWKGGAAA